MFCLLKKYFSNFKDPLVFRNEFKKFAKMSALKEPRFALSWSDRYPILNERTIVTDFDKHYFYHTAWAARILKETGADKHTDISSFLYFSGIVSAFLQVDFYDLRPAQFTLDNLNSAHADLCNLPFPDKSISSLSCMHVVEHVGLGRYGDKLDPESDRRAMNELQRVLDFDGNLLFVVPVGKPKILFNAHRIYDPDQILEEFKELKLIEFALISEHSDSGEFIRNAALSAGKKENYGCGCFWFQREASAFSVRPS